jgi:predicted Zn-dependent protease
MLRAWTTPIIRAASLDPKAVRLVLVQSPDVNAFVAGGQNVFLYTGLIQKTDTADEVIGVVAHELGHIAGGHLVRGTAEMERASYEVMLGAILGIGVAAATGSGDAGKAILGGSSAFAQRKYLSFSRTQESAADQAGLRFLKDAGANPQGLVAFMQKLADQELLPASQQNEYVRTHPLSRDRVNTLQQSLENDTKVPIVSAVRAEDHKRIKAKLLGFLNPSQVAWAYDDRDHSFAAGYARAIAAYRQNQVEEALAQVDALIKREPENPYVYELKGQMLYDFGRISAAVPSYARAVALAPDQPLIALAYAQALMENPKGTPNDLTRAGALLDQVRVAEPRTSRVYRLLATLHGRLGDEPTAQAWLAEEAFLQARYDESRRLAQVSLTRLSKDSRMFRLMQDLTVQLDQMDEKKKED